MRVSPGRGGKPSERRRSSFKNEKSSPCQVVCQLGGPKKDVSGFGLVCDSGMGNARSEEPRGFARTLRAMPCIFHARCDSQPRCAGDVRSRNARGGSQCFPVPSNPLHRSLELIFDPGCWDRGNGSVCRSVPLNSHHVKFRQPPAPGQTNWEPIRRESRCKPTRFIFSPTNGSGLRGGCR
jgi:hypothetical protein